MKLLKSAFVVVAIALASPVWAHGGHGHGHGHGHRHGWHDGRGDFRHHHRHHARFVERRVIVSPQYYYQPYPVYPAPIYSAPAPGVHIVVPNIFIPLR